MWVQMKLSRGRREENRKEKEEPSMRQRRTDRGRENKKQRCQWRGVVQKCEGQQSKPGKDGRISIGCHRTSGDFGERDPVQGAQRGETVGGQLLLS